MHGDPHAVGRRRRVRSGARRVAAAIHRPTGATGFLAGIFDAEGSYSRGILRICNTDDEMIRRTQRCLDRLGFDHVLDDAGAPNRVRYVRLRRRAAPSTSRFFHTIDPAITRKRTDRRRGHQERCADSGWSPSSRLGLDIPMYDITTGTGDFIANGVVSHNCFARPTHDVPRPRHRPRLRAAHRGQGQRGRAAARRARPPAVGAATTSPWAPTPTPTSGPRASTASPGASSRC